MIQMMSDLIASRYTQYKPTLPQPQSFRGFLDILSGFGCELRFLELLGLGGVSDDVFSDWTAIALADESSGRDPVFSSAFARLSAFAKLSHAGCGVVIAQSSDSSADFHSCSIAS